MKSPLVAIIVVNWNGLKFLKNCFNSIFNQRERNFLVYFVDNGSTDGSVEFVKKYFSDVEIIKLKKNEGFAKANNIGIREALKKNKSIKYVCTLNNDTKVAPNFLKKLIEIIETDKKIGSVQAKLLFPNRTIQSVGLLLLPDLLGPLQKGISRGFGEKNNRYNLPQEIFGCTAAATIYRREMFEEIGLFDEDFFCYGEDLDLSLRARLANWKSFFVPTEVIHYHSQTGKALSSSKAYYIRRNTNFVAIKNLPFFYLLRYFFLSKLNYFKLLFGEKKFSPINDLIHKFGFIGIIKLVFKIYFDTFKYLPRILKKRKSVMALKKISNRELKNLFQRFSKN